MKENVYTERPKRKVNNSISTRAIVELKIERDNVRSHKLEITSKADEG